MSSDYEQANGPAGEQSPAGPGPGVNEDPARQAPDGAAASPRAEHETAQGAPRDTAQGGDQQGTDQQGTDQQGGAEAPADAQEQAPLTELEKAKLELLEMADELARRKADLYNLKEEYGRFVRRSREQAVEHRAAGEAKVLESLFGVLDDLALAREHGDLSGPFGSVADKLEATLKTNFGLERYCEVSDEFDPEVHDALMNTESDDVDCARVNVVIAPGYRTQERVLRVARVGVSSPPEGE